MAIREYPIEETSTISSSGIREYPISGQSLTPKSVQDNTKKSFLQQRWENLAKWAPMAESGLRKLTDAEVSAQNYIAQKTGLPIGTSAD